MVAQERVVFHDLHVVDAGGLEDLAGHFDRPAVFQRHRAGDAYLGAGLGAEQRRKVRVGDDGQDLGREAASPLRIEAIQTDSASRWAPVRVAAVDDAFIEGVRTPIVGGQGWGELMKPGTAIVGAGLLRPVPNRLRVLDAVAALKCADLSALGRLFSASHASMRDDFEVSVAAVDLLVQIADAQPEVYGARLTGGGFGGAIVALARPEGARATADRIAAEYSRTSGHRAMVLVPSSR